MIRYPAVFLVSSLLALAVPVTSASAQSLDYDGGDGAGAPVGDEGSADAGAAPKGAQGQVRKAFVEPYIEVEQVVTARNGPQDETFTYTRVAAGVDASLVGQRNGGSVSLRYERRIDWGNNDADGDLISGVANGYATVAPGVQLHAGALATRESIGRDGSSTAGGSINRDEVVQVYSVYAGPSVVTRAGDLALQANYRFGYSKADRDNGRTVVSGQPALDLFDESTVHAADASAVIAPGDVLPVGVGVGGSYYREDVTNLDQRIEDAQARATVTVPVSHSVAVTGAIGYESVQISSRDAVVDENGFPVVGPGGNYITDKSSPRILAYDVDGLIWDAGVMWRPSRRTALTAHVGRRYGSTSYTGTFSYAPSERSALNVAVYDNVAGFGGQINRAIDQLPVDFTVVRDPITGDIGGCVNSLEGGNCLSGVLGSLRSSAFRARGIMANYAVQLGRLSTGIGGGYDRRKYIAAPGTVLAVSNGVIDENYWMVAYLNMELDERSMVETNLYANWIDAGGLFAGDTKSWGATAAYYRDLTRHLAARAALGIEGVDESATPDDLWTASALVGVRYSF